MIIRIINTDYKVSSKAFQIPKTGRKTLILGVIYYRHIVWLNPSRNISLAFVIIFQLMLNTSEG